jgi:hypothetical protein
LANELAASRRAPGSFTEDDVLTMIARTAA